MDNEHVTAWTFVAVGAAKIVLGLLGVVLSVQSPASIQPSVISPWLRWLLGTDGPDDTDGLVLHTVLIIFGMYSLVHGLGLFGVPGLTWAASELFSVGAVLGMGVFLIAYFSRVVFVKPSSSYTWRYELFGVAGGIFMLLGLALRQGSSGINWLKLPRSAPLILAVLALVVAGDALRRAFIGANVGANDGANVGANVGAIDVISLMTYPVLSSLT